MIKLCVWEGHNEIEFRQQQKREERNKKKRRKERRVTRICVLRLFFFFSVTLNIYLAGKLHQVRSPCFASNCGSQGCCQVSASSIFFCGTSERTFPRTRACGDTEREGETDRQTETEREIFTMTTMQFSSLSSSTEYYEGSHRDLTTFCCGKTAGSVTMCITSCTFTDVVMGVGGVNPQ